MSSLISVFRLRGPTSTPVLVFSPGKNKNNSNHSHLDPRRLSDLVFTPVLVFSPGKNNSNHSHLVLHRSVWTCIYSRVRGRTLTTLTWSSTGQYGPVSTPQYQWKNSNHSHLDPNWYLPQCQWKNCNHSHLYLHRYLP